MKTLSYKTESARKEDVTRDWHLINGDGKIVGRTATHIAVLLRGKHKPSFTPHVDTGDYVVVLNAEKFRFSGNKRLQKTYLTYSGYPGGQKSQTADDLFAKKPEEVIRRAVKNMLPKNKLGRQMLKKLFIYTGTEHPHAAQKPQEFKI